MKAGCSEFPANADAALKDGQLRRALARLSEGLPSKRKRAVERLPEFDRLRDAAQQIKDHTLANLDHYLEHFEARLSEAGGHLHWARDATEAQQIILSICQASGAKTVTKSKSMVAEEIGLNAYLEEHGITPVETDLGEYIIQLRDEPPSHIIVPAVHLSKEQVESSFRKSHKDLDPNRDLSKPAALMGEARSKLRSAFLSADLGITGANFLIAETGSLVLVTNEGNADLTHTLPPVHVVVTGIEKLVPTLEDATTLLRVLARSATGQDLSVYTSFVTGPKRPEDPDGPRELHVVVLDNGRSRLLGGERQDVLRCIRCGACMNHCPVYRAVGGHAYGWVYPGPIGAALTPALRGLAETRHLPQASSLCGACAEVCPVRIPLPSLLRQWRQDMAEGGISSTSHRWGLWAWAFLAKRPLLYRVITGMAMTLLGWMGRSSGRFRRLPFAGGWTGQRDLPAPEGGTFVGRYRRSGDE